MEFEESTKTFFERARNDLLKDHKVLKWLEGGGGSVGFCERDALIMHVIADMIRKTAPRL